ncbi:MAG TPA: hypothetical protein DCX03_07145 [Bacteroidales bacterium]|nr:hypothetical protein [Bacteroidales bacterium]
MKAGKEFPFFPDMAAMRLLAFITRIISCVRFLRFWANPKRLGPWLMSYMDMPIFISKTKSFGMNKGRMAAGILKVKSIPT